MQHAAAHYPPRDMAVLGVVELALSFALIHLMLQTVGASLPLLELVALFPRGEVARAAAFTVIIGSVAMIIGLYRPEVCLNPKRLLIATGAAAVITFGVLLLISRGPIDALSGGRFFYIGVMLAAWLCAMTSIRLAYGFAISHLSLARRVLLLGTPSQIGKFAGQLRSRRDHLFDPVVLHGQPVSWHLLQEQDIWGVVVASPQEGHSVDSMLDCKLRGVRVLSGAAFNEQYLGRIDLETLTANDLLLGQGFGAGRISMTMKRLCDVVLGVCLLVLTLPLMAMTAMAIRFESPGPVFYRQQRVGQFGESFMLYKFRSMQLDAEVGGDPRWAERRDPRVTRIGRFIRASRIDELPQLVNILRGEMSLVGPRPERPHFVEQLARAIPFYRQRAYVKPGLTGWAQVNYPYGASVEDAREKLAYDLYYAKHRSMILDLIILVSTIRVVLFREGAR